MTRRRPETLLMAIVLAVMVGGCGPSAAGDPADDSPELAQPVRAEAVSWPFRLAFELPRTTWQAGSPIVGQARLELIEREAVVFSGSGGGPLAFAFTEIDGRREMQPARTADCARHELRAQDPLTSPITRSGGFSASDPDAAFFRAFFDAPDVRLPAGQWEIAAVASLIEGPECSGRQHELRAPIRIVVTP